MKSDSFGDRMKEYEDRETGRRFLPYIPVYARIDGRGFSKFTRDAAKPFDEHISRAMIAATTALVTETKATIGYTQSDEISLVWTTREPGEEMFFKGKVQKLCSVLAGLATSAFVLSLLKSESEWQERLSRMPHFDSRVVQLPNRVEAANMILWREMDARKNAISMAAHAQFSHKSLQGLNSRQKIEKLNAESDVVFDDYPMAFRRGTFVRREVSSVEMPEEIRMVIPEKSRPEPGAKITRLEVKIVDMPQFNHVVNRAEVVFDGAVPVMEEIA
jgi:tRNA(His) 5'-end guanylyltransferase